MIGLALDNFVRANGGLGSNWTTPTPYSAPTIVSDSVETSITAANNVAVWTGALSVGTSWPANQGSKVTITTCTAAYDYMGVVCRCSLSADTCYVGFVTGPLGATATLTISKRVAGVYTSLATGTFTVSSGDTIELDVIGNSLTLYHNGTSALTASDSSIASGYPGVILYSGSYTYDNVLNSWVGYGSINFLLLQNAAGPT